jgi:hypothetical protein
MRQLYLQARRVPPEGGLREVQCAAAGAPRTGRVRATLSLKRELSRPGVGSQNAPMGGEASCPECDSPVLVAQMACPRCGFALVEERIVGGGRHLACGPGRRRPARLLPPVVAASALITAAAAGLVLLTVPIARSPASDALSPAEAERRLALRYPRLRYAENAVIACPDRAIQPGGAARCWVLARVGLQRSVIVRLSQRGNQVEIED